MNNLKIKLFSYFKTGFSPTNNSEISKYGDLLRFKESLNDTVLYSDYPDTSKFGECLKDNLHNYLADVFPKSLTSNFKSHTNEVLNLATILTEKQSEINQLKKMN